METARTGLGTGWGSRVTSWRDNCYNDYIVAIVQLTTMAAIDQLFNHTYCHLVIQLATYLYVSIV